MSFLTGERTASPFLLSAPIMSIVVCPQGVMKIILQN